MQLSMFTLDYSESADSLRRLIEHFASLYYLMPNKSQATLLQVLFVMVVRRRSHLSLSMWLVVMLKKKLLILLLLS